MNKLILMSFIMLPLVSVPTFAHDHMKKVEKEVTVKMAYDRRCKICTS